MTDSESNKKFTAEEGGFYKKLIFTFLSIFLLVAAMVSVVTFGARFWPGSEKSAMTDADTENTEGVQITWGDPQLDEVPKGMMGEFIRYGHDLVTKTYKYIGPNVADPSKRFAGNNLACQNCHLAGGTKKFAAPYIGLDARFPQYRGRENTIGTLQERINGCMQRSMNGRNLPVDSKEMKAIIAYFEWLSRDIPGGTTIEGRGYPEIEIPNRKANLENGEQVFATYCASCHQLDGSGLIAGKPSDTLGYIYPPLWGDDSFNNGAGMHRVLTAASFIKANMPLGATHENPLLTDEEAYDVAAYINSKLRPKKENLEQDYPDLTKKPVDSPYPPYSDSFPQVQHQFGPFQPIIEARKKLESSQN